MVMGYFINTLTARMIGGWVYRVLVAPGVIIHEFSHALGCLITGAKIQSINFFKRDGGELKHTGSPIPVIGNVVISLMPMVTGILILYFTPKLSNLTNLSNWSNYSTWQFWAFIYLIFNLVATMAPSKQDIKNIWWDLLVLAGIFYVLSYTNLSLNIVTLLPFLIFSLVLALGVLIFVILLYFIIKIF